MATVTDIFNQLGLPLWWKLSNITQDFNGANEKGADYGLGGMGRPVGSITSGKVVYVGDGGYPGSSIGQIVQVLTPDGALVHYQHLKTSNVHLGQAVQTGNIIGTGGGCPVGAYWGDPSRNDCMRYDQFSTGQHIEVRFSPTYNPSAGVWSQNWVSPSAIFVNLAGKPANAPTNSPVDNTNNSTNTGGGSSPIDFTQWGVKVGIFLLALVVLAFGFYIIFQKQVDQTVSAGAKVAVKAALA